MEISDLFKSVPALIVAVIGVLAALLKVLKALVEFHDDHLSKRAFKRHSFLVNEAEQNNELKTFVEALKHEAIFQTTFGKPASPRKASAVMQLYKSGHFSHADLRESYLFLVLNEADELEVRVGVLGNILLVLTSLYLIFVLTYIGYLGLQLPRLLNTGSPGIVLLGSAFLFLTVWHFGRDLRSILLAKKVRKKLESLKSKKLAAQKALPTTTEQPSPVQSVLAG